MPQRHIGLWQIHGPTILRMREVTIMYTIMASHVIDRDVTDFGV